MENKNISITINKGIINEFGILAIKKDIPRKQLIERALNDYLNKVKSDEVNN